jgi:cytochrome c biogenesis protein CcmG/thiol:disulfide interchange protein DsbE
VLVVTVVGAAAVALLGADLGLRPRASAGPSGSTVVISGSPLIGRPAPDFVLERLDGGTDSLAAYRGRPLVINFWASWCEPCKTEFPLFADARERHAAEGLEILGIVHDDDAASARAFVEAEGAAWPMFLDPDDTAWDAYAGFGLPMSFYVDRDGIVRNVSYGPPASGSLEEILADIL